MSAFDDEGSLAAFIGQVLDASPLAVFVRQMQSAAGAFSAIAPGTQKVLGSTATKVQLTSEEWDISDWYDKASSRYTPALAGYYHFGGAVGFSDSLATGTRVIVTLYMNGAVEKKLMADRLQTAENDILSIPGGVVAYANGLTDYFELYVNQTDTASDGTGGKTISGSSSETFFQAHYIGGA